jgi:hypothetical protein
MGHGNGGSLLGGFGRHCQLPGLELSPRTPIQEFAAVSFRVFGIGAQTVTPSALNAFSILMNVDSSGLFLPASIR